MGRPRKVQVVMAPAIEEEQEKQEIQVYTPTAISELNRSEIDVQIATAKRYPRSIKKFRQDALSMATADMQIAASCFYKLKRGTSIIEGPSIRLAEIVASAWGNIRVAAHIIEEGDKCVVARGAAHDLERNYFGASEIRRRITYKDGTRYNDDMTLVTMAAACAIARRNAILEVIPRTYVNFILDLAKKVAVGSAKTLAERRQRMFEEFSKMGVSKEQLLTFVEKPSLEDVDLTDIETLIGTFTAIKEGATTIDQQFPSKKAGVSMPVAKKEVVEPDGETTCTPEQQKVIADLAKKIGIDKTFEILTSFQVNQPAELTVEQAKKAIEKFSKVAFGKK